MNHSPLLLSKARIFCLYFIFVSEIIISGRLLVLNFIVFSNILLLFIIFYFRKENVLPNKILAFIFLTPGLNLINNVNILAGNMDIFPFFYFLAQSTTFVFAPLVHFYINLLMNKTFNWKHPLLLLSLLGVAVNLFFTLEFFLMAKENQSDYIDGLINGPYPWQMDVINTAFSVLMLSYFSLFIVQVIRYRKKVINTYANLNRTKLNFLKNLVILIWMLNLGYLSLMSFLPITWVEYAYAPTGQLIINYFIIYYGFRDGVIFTHSSYQQFLKNNPNIEWNVPPSKAIEEGSLSEIALQITKKITEKEIYGDAELNIQKFASKLNFPVYQVSKAINAELGKNFFELINEARVEAAKLLLKSDSKNKLSVEGIAYEVGFNSRSAFYRAFKKYTDTTPIEFMSNKDSIKLS